MGVILMSDLKIPLYFGNITPEELKRIQEESVKRDSEIKKFQERPEYPEESILDFLKNKLQR